MAERLDFVLRLIDKISAPAKRMSKSLGGVSKSLADIDKNNRALRNLEKGAVDASLGIRKLNQAGNSMISTAGSLNLAANSMRQFSRAAATAFLTPVQEAATFERAMSAVEAVTSDFSDEQTALARQLGEQTKFTAEEAAGAMLFLGRAGFTAQQQMQSLATVLDLDAASGMNNLAQSADIVTNIMSGFGLQASETTDAGDTLTRIFSNANVTLEEMGQTMSFVGPVAKQVGVSLKEAAILTGALGDAGIKGTRAGTSLRLMLTNLAGASPPAAKALDALGVRTKDAGNNLLPLSQILEDLVEKFSKLGTADKTAQASKIFGQRGMTAGLVLLDSLANKASGSIEKLNRASDDLNVTSKSVAETMEQNLLGDVTKVQSAFSSLLIEIGSQFTPELRGMAQEITRMIPKITGWVSENKSLVISLGKSLAIFSAVTAALSGIAIAASSAALVFGGLAKASAGMLLFWDKIGLASIWLATKFVAVKAALAPVIASVWAGTKAAAALAAGFITLPVAILGALAAVSVGIFVWWDEIEAFMMGIGAKMFDIGVSIADGLKSGWTSVFGSWSPAEEAMGVVSSIKSALGIASPSRVMMGVGEDMARGMQVGMQSTMATGGATGGPPGAAVARATSTAGASEGAKTMVFSPVVHVTVGSGSEADGAAIGESVSDAVRKLFDDGVTALGAG